MTFLWPVMFLGLLLIPLFVAGYVRLQAQRRRLLAQYGNLGLAQTVASLRPGLRRHLPPLLFLLALIILIAALARPQTLVSLPRLEGRIILAFDVSGSMAGDDLKPTRLDAAKTAARAFVQRQPATVQIGVVSFSEGGFAAQAPTGDSAAVVTAINRLSVQRGTSLGQGIQASLNVLAADANPPLSLSTRTQTATPTPVPKGTYTSSVIVLLTDGENNEAPDPLTIAQAAADQGVRIYTVGVGSADGATLHLNGFTVRSRLDEATLRQIAQLTGGTYQSAASEDELNKVYDNLNPTLIVKPQKTEVTALFAGVGIVVLLLGGTLSLLWFGRVP